MVYCFSSNVCRVSDTNSETAFTVEYLFFYESHVGVYTVGYSYQEKTALSKTLELAKILI